MFEVTCMQICIIIGLGVLGLPWAFARCAHSLSQPLTHVLIHSFTHSPIDLLAHTLSMGWILGLFFLAVSAFGAIYSGYTISALVKHITAHHGPPRKYSDLGFAAFGEGGRNIVIFVQVNSPQFVIFDYNYNSVLHVSTHF